MSGSVAGSASLPAAAVAVAAAAASARGSGLSGDDGAGSGSPAAAVDGDRGGGPDAAAAPKAVAGNRVRDVVGLRDGHTIHLVPRPKPPLQSSSQQSRSNSSSLTAEEGPEGSRSEGGAGSGPAGTGSGGGGGSSPSILSGDAGAALLAALLGLGSVSSPSSPSGVGDDDDDDDEAVRAGTGDGLGGGGAGLLGALLSLGSPSSPTAGGGGLAAATRARSVPTANPLSGLGRRERRSGANNAAGAQHHRLTEEVVRRRREADPGDPEGVRQGLLTIHTLLHGIGRPLLVVDGSARDDEAAAGGVEVGMMPVVEEEKRADEIDIDDDDRRWGTGPTTTSALSTLTPSTTVPSSWPRPDAPRRWYRGQWLDCRDTVNQWLEATVVDIVVPEDVLLCRQRGRGTERERRGEAVGGDRGGHRGQQGQRRRQRGRWLQYSVDAAVGANDFEGRRQLLLEPAGGLSSYGNMDDGRFCVNGDRPTWGDETDDMNKDGGGGEMEEEEEVDDPGWPYPGYHERSHNDGVQLLLVHYNGWPHRWDEWIRSDSERLRPFRTRTRHVPGSPLSLSPGAGSAVSSWGRDRDTAGGGGETPRIRPPPSSCPVPNSVFHGAPDTRIAVGVAAMGGWADSDSEARVAVLVELIRTSGAVSELVEEALMPPSPLPPARAISTLLPGTVMPSSLSQSRVRRILDGGVEIEANNDLLPWLLPGAGDNISALAHSTPPLSSVAATTLDPVTRAERLRALAPLLDRIGRAFVDAAPHAVALAEASLAEAAKENIRDEGNQEVPTGRNDLVSQAEVTVGRGVGAESPLAILPPSASAETQDVEKDEGEEDEGGEKDREVNNGTDTDNREGAASTLSSSPSLRLFSLEEAVADGDPASVPLLSDRGSPGDELYPEAVDDSGGGGDEESDDDNPDFVDYVNGTVNVSHGPIVGRRGASSGVGRRNRVSDGESNSGGGGLGSSLLAAYLAAAGLGALGGGNSGSGDDDNENGGEGGSEGQGGGGGGGPRIISLNGNGGGGSGLGGLIGVGGGNGGGGGGGGIDIHIHAVVSGPGMFGGGGGGGVGLPLGLLGALGGGGDAIGGTEVTGGAATAGPLNADAASASAAPQLSLSPDRENDDMDEMGLFSDLYTETSEPVRWMAVSREGVDMSQDTSAPAQESDEDSDDEISTPPAHYAKGSSEDNRESIDQIEADEEIPLKENSIRTTVLPCADSVSTISHPAPSQSRPPQSLSAPLSDVPNPDPFNLGESDGDHSVSLENGSSSLLTLPPPPDSVPSSPRGRVAPFRRLLRSVGRSFNGRGSGSSGSS